MSDDLTPDEREWLLWINPDGCGFVWPDARSMEDIQGIPVHVVPKSRLESLEQRVAVAEHERDDAVENWKLDAASLRVAEQRVVLAEEYAQFWEQRAVLAKQRLQITDEMVERAEQDLQVLRDALQAYTDHDSMFYVQPLLGAKHAREALARSSREIK